MDNSLHITLRRALKDGLSFRMRLDDEAAEPTLYLRLIENGAETTWAADLPPDGDLEDALLILFTSCAEKIVEIGERDVGDRHPSGRPLPTGSGVSGGF